MLTFLIFLAPPIVVVLLFKIVAGREITHREFWLHLGVTVLCVGAFCGISLAIQYDDLEDVEILNGSVLEKYKHEEECTQSSSCKNYSIYFIKKPYYDKGKLKYRTETRKRFDYSTEFDWYVRTSFRTYEIDRVNDRGDEVPPRWELVKIGDYAADTHRYINPLLMGGNKLFTTDVNYSKIPENAVDKLPMYPAIYDYYNFNHIVNMTVHDVNQENTFINAVLKGIGSTKQVNTIVVLYDYQNSQLPSWIIQKWHGGKKNDVIVMLGVDDKKVVKSVTPYSYGSGSGNEVLLNTLEGYTGDVFDIEYTRKIMVEIEKDFHRMEASKFRYMLMEIKPSIYVLYFAIFVSIVLGVILVRNNERN